MPDASQQPQSKRLSCPPRVIRAGAAPAYLGMCRDEFNRTVRPHVREFRIGRQGIGFDREELDAWADDYIERTVIEKNGAGGQDRSRSERQGEKPWREKPSQASTREMESGMSTRSSEVSDFKKALEQATGRKQSST
ncbi:hypothetical protein [Zestomonas carbonaria]|uniref:hypothetical protein n=1 Tax=Zestomonas carbonaria TaxID=2762745 RepID=UPI001F464341|nr:hypothetical protein [Pseudomonas carbonaria]